MGRLQGLSRGGRVLLALAIGGAVFGIATAVQASIPDANGVIHGCYNTSLAHGNPIGGLRVIDTAKLNGNCASWETPLNWNQRGVTGPTGVGGTGLTARRGRPAPGGRPGPLQPDWRVSFAVSNTQVIPAGGDVSFAASVAGPQAGSIVHINPASPSQLVFDRSGAYAITISVLPNNARVRVLSIARTPQTLST